MILTRLYELAQREKLLEDPAFEYQPVPYVIMIGDDGAYLGLIERRGMTLIPSKKKDAEPKKVPDKGERLSVPRAHGNPANQGFARYFMDTLARVVPVTLDLKDEPTDKRNQELAKRERSRVTFWQQIEKAARETDSPALEAIRIFGRQLLSDPDLVSRIEHDIQSLKASSSDRCTFAWDPDAGPTIVERPDVRDWYRSFFRTETGKKQDAGPQGLCQITGVVGPIPTTHPIRIAGVPGGLSTGVSLVSYDKAAFESYGLEGTANAGIGYEAADGYARAIEGLIQNKLQGNPKSSLRLGDALFLFWTREPTEMGFMTPIENPDPANVQALMESALKGGDFSTVEDPNNFYCLTLSGNSARAIVRDYLETTVATVKRNLAQWFNDLRIASTAKDAWGEPSEAFPLWMLASSTALDSDSLAPDVAPKLVRAALESFPLTDSILAACLGRLRAEGSSGFRPARMALIKLFLLRRNHPVTETLNPEERNPAYICGRLLEVFEEIQYEALGSVNASVVDKYFGAFSAAPATVLGRLYANAQNHLRTLRGEERSAFHALDKRLTEISALLEAPPHGQLSLIDQGHFALGYYHQKAKRFEAVAKKKDRDSQKQGSDDNV